MQMNVTILANIWLYENLLVHKDQECRYCVMIQPYNL